MGWVGLGAWRRIQPVPHPPPRRSSHAALQHRQLTRAALQHRHVCQHLGHAAARRRCQAQRPGQCAAHRAQPLRRHACGRSQVCQPATAAGCSQSKDGAAEQLHLALQGAERVQVGTRLAAQPGERRLQSSLQGTQVAGVRAAVRGGWEVGAMSGRLVGPRAAQRHCTGNLRLLRSVNKGWPHHAQGSLQARPLAVHLWRSISRPQRGRDAGQVGPPFLAAIQRLLQLGQLGAQRLELAAAGGVA